MEKPDADGYVTVKWPSDSVPHGGIFHSKVADQSEANSNFLKLLLQESQLSAAERKKIRWEHRLRDYSDDQKQTLSRILERTRPMVRPKTSRRRSLSEIRCSGVYEADDFRPMKRGEDREKLKEKLQNVMAFGDTGFEVWPKPPRPEPEPTNKIPTVKDVKNELITQIRERVEWLADMEFLGEGAKHRDIIQDQIAEKLREMQELGLSECTTARTSDSGFSTTRSREVLTHYDQDTPKKLHAGSAGQMKRTDIESPGKTKVSNTESAGKTKRSNSESLGKQKELLSPVPEEKAKEDSARILNYEKEEQTKRSNTEGSGKTKRSNTESVGKAQDLKEPLPTIQQESAKKSNTGSADPTKTLNTEGAGKLKESPNGKQDSARKNAVKTIEPVLEYQKDSAKKSNHSNTVRPHLPFQKNSAKKSNTECSVKTSLNKIQPYLEYQQDTARMSNAGSAGQTKRSNTEIAKNTVRSQQSVASQGSKKSIKSTALSHKSKKEESVHDYEVEKAPLLPSPRRRC